MRNFKYLSTLLLSLPLMASSCKKPVDDGEVVLPTNLATVVNIDEGLVDIQATANNTNYYSFMFFEGPDSTYVEATDGIASYTFSSSGTFTIRTRAHVSFSEYIEKVETVTISLTPTNTGLPPTTGYDAPLTYPGYSLVWNDEFNGNSLSSDWVYEIGNGTWGWGNNELQYYRQDNVNVDNGILTITAKSELFGGYGYTSSRIKTQGNRSFKYGRVDIRAALPRGKGLWPALWMVGDNITSVGWPACGEIDIMELVGGAGLNDRTVHGTLHWDQNGHANYGGSNSLPSGTFGDEWHVFSIEWNETQIKFFRDGSQYHVMNITGPELTEFHENFFFIFNVAVGGNWPGSPDTSTEFPQRMYVDYIRVYQ